MSKRSEMREEPERESVNDRSSVLVKVRCYSCVKVFIVKLTKREDIADDEDEIVEMSCTCPHCGKYNAFEVKKSEATAMSAAAFQADLGLSRIVAAFEAITKAIIKRFNILEGKKSTARPEQRGAMDSESRFAGLDLDYYKQRIPPEQFRLLMDFLSYSAPGNFDPEEIFYPEDL